MAGGGGKKGNVFVGKQQPSRSRAPEIPDVNYAKGKYILHSLFTSLHFTYFTLSFLTFSWHAICPIDCIGGDDFRVIERTSSFGRQVQSTREAAGTVPMPVGARFKKSDSYGPGPCLVGQMSCMGRQKLSTRRSYGSITFGTSTRDGAKRLYTLGNSKPH